jgi:hypothetical protein
VVHVLSGHPCLTTNFRHVPLRFHAQQTAHILIPVLTGVTGLGTHGPAKSIEEILQIRTKLLDFFVWKSPLGRFGSRFG